MPPACTLTASGTNSPSRASFTDRATATPALSWASTVEAPRCGVTTTDSNSNSGESVHGSVTNTSMPAPATWPLARASASACSSTSPPRAAFTMRTPRLHRASCSAPIRPSVSGRLGQVDRDEVALAQQLLEADQLDAELRRAGRREVGVVRDQPGAEGTHPLGEQHADATEADHADGLVGDLDAGPLRALPLPGLEGGVGRGDVAGAGQQQRDGLLGCADHVAQRGVDDHHAAGRGSRDVDVVQADAGAGHHLQARRGGERLGVEHGGAADQDRLDVSEGRQQRGAVGTVDVADVEAVPQDREDGRSELLRDKHDRTVGHGQVPPGVWVMCHGAAGRQRGCRTYRRVRPAPASRVRAGPVVPARGATRGRSRPSSGGASRRRPRSGARRPPCGTAPARGRRPRRRRSARA